MKGKNSSFYQILIKNEFVVFKIAEKFNCDILKIDTVKEMPKSFAARILIGGGQVAMNIISEIKPINKDLNAYDEIFIGTPIWNSKGVSAINAFLKDENVCQKITRLIITSGGWDIDRCVKTLESKIPNVKYKVSFLDRKHKDYGNNIEKINEFINAVL